MPLVFVCNLSITNIREETHNISGTSVNSGSLTTNFWIRHPSMVSWDVFREIRDQTHAFAHYWFRHFFFSELLHSGSASLFLSFHFSLHSTLCLPLSLSSFLSCVCFFFSLPLFHGCSSARETREKSETLGFLVSSSSVWFHCRGHTTLLLSYQPIASKAACFKQRFASCRHSTLTYFTKTWPEYQLARFIGKVPLPQSQSTSSFPPFLSLRAQIYVHARASLHDMDILSISYMLYSLRELVA